MTTATHPPGAARAALAQLTNGGGPWPSAWQHAVGKLDPTARDAAVLVLFGALDSIPAEYRDSAVAADLDVLLLARAATLGSHPGQVAFPGGRVDTTDASVTETALREAVEETGLDVEGVEVLGALGELPLPASNHRVTPILAWWGAPSSVGVVDHNESAHVFRAPVADLLNPERRRTAVVDHRGRTFRSPAFLVTDGNLEHLVWGFTAGVLDALFDRLGWTEPWDATHEIPAK